MQVSFYIHQKNRNPKTRHMHIKVTNVALLDKRFNKLRLTSSLPIKPGQRYIVKPTKFGERKYIVIDSKGILGVKGAVIGKLIRSKIYSWWKFIPFKRR